MSEDRAVFDLPLGPTPTQIAYGSDPDQVMDMLGIALPERRAIALVHGGFWRPEYDRAHLRPLARALSRDGQVFNIEYRRIPGAPNEQLEDVCTALRWITTTTGRPPVVIGHSAGGHLALLAAIHHPDVVAACIAIAPVTDLVAMDATGADDDAVAAFLGTGAAAHPHLDPMQLPRPDVPWLILHGAHDIRVPVDTSHAYGDAVITRDVGHFEWIDPRTTAGIALMEQVWAWARVDAPTA